MGSGIDPEIPAKLLSCEKFAELSGTVGESSQLAVRLRKYAHRQESSLNQRNSRVIPVSAC
jgi:hypothetical protein